MQVFAELLQKAVKTMKNNLFSEICEVDQAKSSFCFFVASGQDEVAFRGK